MTSSAASIEIVELSPGDPRLPDAWRVLRELAHRVNMHLGRSLYVEDLVTTVQARSAGHGSLLLAHLRDVARAARCRVVHLDSGVQRAQAHRFYFREGMSISSFHFVQEVTEQPSTGG